MRRRGLLLELIGRIGRPDPALAPVKEWLEIEHAEGHRRAFRVMAQIGICLLVAVLSAAIVTGLVNALAPRAMDAVVEAWLAAILSVGSAGAMVGFVGLPLMRRIPAKASHPGNVMAAIDDLELHAYGSRLRRKLGEGGFLALSEGATLFLRCRSALTTETWSVSSPSDPWDSARRDLLRATESTMGRLALFVVKRRTFAETADLLEQLRLAANEAERATLARVNTGVGSGSDIRASVARLRELTVAEDELLRIRE